MIAAGCRAAWEAHVRRYDDHARCAELARSRSVQLAMEQPKEPPSILHAIVLSHTLDEEGRALYEGKAAPELVRTIPVTLAPFRYEDSPSRSRSGKPIRQDAYRQVKDHFDDVLWVFSALREMYVAEAKPASLEIADLRRICMMAQALPRYLRVQQYCASSHRSKPSQLDEFRVPVAVSVVFKSVLGITNLLDYITAHEAEVREARLARDPNAPAEWTAEDLLWVAETYGLLVGDSEVCAAPASMIQRSLRTLLEGRAGGKRPAVVHMILAEREPFLEFSRIVTSATGAIRRFKAFARSQSEVLMRELRVPPGQPLSWQETKRLVRHVAPYFNAECALLSDLASAQREMHALFGRADEAASPAIGLSELDTFIYSQNPRAALQLRHRFRVQVSRSEIALVSEGGGSCRLSRHGRAD